MGVQAWQVPSVAVAAPSPSLLRPATGPTVTWVMVRDATERDWSAIYPFFNEIVAKGQTFAYPEDLSSEQARSWWMEPPPGRTVVATEGPTVLGSAKMGPNRPGRGAHVATASFMVDPQHSRRGVGRALGEHVIDWARTSGYRSIQFNAVVELNEAAVRLWSSLGFLVLTTVPEAFDHADYGLVGLHVMYLDLGAADLADEGPETPTSGVDRGSGSP